MLDRNKPVQTRDGCKAGVYRWDAPGRYPIHGWAEFKPGEHVTWSWTSEGKFLANATEYDLINAPEVTERWVNVYAENCGISYKTKVEAHNHKSSVENRLALLRLTYTDGIPTAVELIRE